MNCAVTKLLIVIRYKGTKTAYCTCRYTRQTVTVYQEAATLASQFTVYPGLYVSSWFCCESHLSSINKINVFSLLPYLLDSEFSMNYDFVCFNWGKKPFLVTDACSMIKRPLQPFRGARPKDQSPNHVQARQSYSCPTYARFYLRQGCRPKVQFVQLNALSNGCRKTSRQHFLDFCFDFKHFIQLCFHWLSHL